MFRDAIARDRQLTAESFEQALSRYHQAAESWFDGTPHSVDRRLTACNRLLHSCRATVARITIGDAGLYLKAQKELEDDHRTLTALREDLLTGGSYWAPTAPPGHRTASSDHLAALDGSDRRWVELESAKFIAANAACDDSDELAIRAAYHAANYTSAFPQRRSQAICAAFVARVGELGQRTVRPRQASRAPVFEEFDPAAIYVC